MAALVDGVALASDYVSVTRYDAAASTGGDLLGDSTSPEAWQQLVTVVQVGAFLLTVVVFVWWFRRAYRNLRALGGLQRFRQGWAVAGWFVPILSFFRPKQLANDIWRGSEPSTPTRTPVGDEPVSPLLGWWWGVLLVTGFVDRASLHALGPSPTASDYSAAWAWSMAGDLGDIASAALAIAVVWIVGARQAARHAALA